MGELDAVFRALSAGRRRRTLCHLQRHRAVTLADLAELLAEQECGTDVSELPAERVTELYMSLYHTHVPLLEEAGLAHYDQELDLLARTERTRSLLGTARDEMSELVVSP